ncbi:SusD/RagB family nutrient-binding outer membrane lipoprotein [Parabacteroides sp. AF18-52]|uniref:SusD/RagB family nutrient-binding outer membrane lipoprotein n=1 Tax=Parabacteroides TaxID=375288 RepID=UPI000F0092D3|nr:SusD/RagB family nutrient-binding outer membrane lipoprotein [Parabacteroides sp. AF18-52]RHR38684.1 SusD/RagB family nutrient-binding outer membrane lipoprotein [Parabacteroides sp. AF18-52]
MKKIFLYSALLAAMVTFNGCSEDDFDSKYKDPSKVSEVTLDKMMSGCMLRANDWACSTYGRYFGYDPQLMGKLANSLGFTLSGSVYYDDEYEDYGQPYNSYPSMVTDFRKMQEVYDALPDEEKPKNEGYLLAAETHLYGMMIFILSEYNDIPFNEIGLVALNGDVSYANPHYEDGQQLFEMILDRLGEIDKKFATIEKPSAFGGQDFINKGDMTLWRRYANSLRLRAALRVSTQGPLAAKGQAILKEILEGDYPIVEDLEQNIKIARQSSGPLDIEGGSGFDWHNLQTGSAEMINRMQKAGDGGVWVEGQDDPRLPLMYCMATANGEQPTDVESEVVVGDPLKTGIALPSVFRGASANTSYDTFNDMFFNRLNRGFYSRVRRNGFFWGNKNWDHQIVSSFEIQFIKAEVYQRGWVAGDAKAAFKEGIRQSIKFLFKYQNGRSVTETDNGDSDYLNGKQQRYVINPDQSIYDDAWIDQFAEARWSTHINGTPYTDGNLEAILEQKWVAFGYLYCGEQWCDLRRTGYPRMYYEKDHDVTAIVPYPCNRLRYIANERNYNVHFQDEVGTYDNYADVLFWAKADWHDGPTW